MRGGPIFRGESFEGRTLFDRAQAVCRKVANIASDGHGNPIPVVAKISYDVSRTGLELSTLDVTYTKDAALAALENARQHRQNIVGASPVQGSASLCARTDQGVSCQIVSPYPGNIELVVYCDQATCRMPILAANATIAISASWAHSQNDPALAGAAIHAKVSAIHDFLEPLASGL